MFLGIGIQLGRTSKSANEVLVSSDGFKLVSSDNEMIVT